MQVFVDIAGIVRVYFFLNTHICGSTRIYAGIVATLQVHIRCNVQVKIRPACDSAPGRLPNPPSKFIQLATNLAVWPTWVARSRGAMIDEQMDK